MNFFAKIDFDFDYFMSEFILFHVFGPLKTKENNKKLFLHNSISKIKESRILYIIFFFLKNNDEDE